jgi:dolichol-phosphate mannosyltransferase
MKPLSVPNAAGSPLSTPESWPPPRFPSVSVIVPTFQEASNLPALIERIEQVRCAAELDLELLIVDDDSRDGTDELIARLGRPWVRLIVRQTQRGLSPAVIEGLNLATRDVVVVMDADLSHPPEKIPELLTELENGAEFVIGSRYVSGGATGDTWGAFRWLNSKVATWLARPLTSAADPLSGFFAFRRNALKQAAFLNPVGYKIGLELIVKCGFRRVVEVPIFFAQRQSGQSKLTFKQQLQYVQHLRRLMVFKYPFWSRAVQFGIVGGSGVVVNLAVLTALLQVGTPVDVAVAVAICVSLLSNFALNRRVTFSHARADSVWRQLIGFVAACSVGAAVNYGITVALVATIPGIMPQVASLVGIAGGTAINFLASHHFVFRK